ncbi:MAG: 3'-5' exonuclease [Opitutales bacterium]
MDKAEAPLFTPEELVDPKVEITVPRGTVNQLPLGRYEGPIELISDVAALPSALERLRREPLLGFDTESRPVFRRGQSSLPALLQLAGKDMVWLFQLQQLEPLDDLFAVLADPHILKVGVAIRDDIKKLAELHPFEPAGFAEISDFTQKAGIVNTGLRSLTALFLQFRISKGAQVSNWARKELSSSQVRYAATDAWVSRELYLKLVSMDLATAARPASLAS